jgi:hypothetical protein
VSVGTEGLNIECKYSNIWNKLIQTPLSPGAARAGRDSFPLLRQAQHRLYLKRGVFGVGSTYELKDKAPPFG